MGPEDPYTNRGRTEEVWKVLLVYGFSRKTNAKGKHSFVDSVPSPCFEKYVRDACRSNRYLIDSNGELTHFPIEKIVREVKSYPYFEPYQKKRLSKLSDMELVRHSLSKRGLDMIGGGFYFSLCRDSLEQSDYTWHCRICKECKDWRTWHCGSCK